MYNTELLKDTRYFVFGIVNTCVMDISRFTDAKVLLGNQQLLMQLITKRELNIEKLNDYTTTQLTGILKKIGVEKSELKK